MLSVILLGRFRSFFVLDRCQIRAFWSSGPVRFLTRIRSIPNRIRNSEWPTKVSLCCTIFELSAVDVSVHHRQPMRRLAIPANISDRTRNRDFYKVGSGLFEGSDKDPVYPIGNSIMSSPGSYLDINCNFTKPRIRIYFLLFIMKSFSTFLYDCIFLSPFLPSQDHMFEKIWKDFFWNESHALFLSTCDTQQATCLLLWNT